MDLCREVRRDLYRQICLLLEFTQLFSSFHRLDAPTFEALNFYCK